MNNIIVLPMIIPLLSGIILTFFRTYIRMQRWISFIAMLSTAGISYYILHVIQRKGILRLDFGGWKPPFGILFVADSFAMLLVLTTSVVTAICLLYAFSSTEKAREHMYFYPFVLFLIAG